MDKQKIVQLENRIQKLEFQNKMLRAEMDIVRPKKKVPSKVKYK